MVKEYYIIFFKIYIIKGHFSSNSRAISRGLCFSHIVDVFALAPSSSSSAEIPGPNSRAYRVRDKPTTACDTGPEGCSEIPDSEREWIYDRGKPLHFHKATRGLGP